MAGSPLWAVGGNFQINGHTFKKYCSPLLSVDRLIIFHGCARSARDLRSCAPNATIYDMTPKKLTWVNPRTGKEWQNTYGCHHSKYFIIGSKDGVRVAIHTANLISCDINNKSQGIWMQDFPIKTAGAPATSDFEEQLVKYFLSLQKHAARMPMSWRGLGDAFDDEPLTIAGALRKFDYSGAKARLVASTPGYHSGADLHSFGANRVAALLAKEGDAAAQKPDDQIYCQFSSFSSPTNPLAALKAAFHAPKRFSPPPPEVQPQHSVADRRGSVRERRGLRCRWRAAFCAEERRQGAPRDALPLDEGRVVRFRDGAPARDAAHQDLDARVGRRLDGSMEHPHVGEPLGRRLGQRAGRRPDPPHHALGARRARDALDPGRAAPDDARLGRRHRAFAVSLPAAALRARRRAVLVGGALRDARPLGQARHEGGLYKCK